ncbi:hypothetical protein PDJAM_G00256040 [Pangasius djambal]|uniref:Uncharacterized protein n=1 Tax=Pangasius djambal TaxID=1691987 RepID=A0ACC5YMC3_9TELE|nr:hypothetical protein [Pangasius djambal]
MLVRRSGVQSVFQFIPKVFSGVEVRALCRTLEFFHSNLHTPCLHGARFVHSDIVMLEQCQFWRSRESWRLHIRGFSVRTSGLGESLLAVNMELEAMTRYTSPVNPAVFPHLTVVLLAIGMFFTAWFFVYEVTSTKYTRDIYKELLISLVASLFMGFGVLFLLLWVGIYV